MKVKHGDIKRIIVSERRIEKRVSELANQISDDYSGIERLYLVGILKGAFIFLADLSRKLKVSHVVDFMALSSYGKTTITGAVRLLMDLREPIEGQHVLIVEDIADSGQTLTYLYHLLQGRNPASLKTCVLLRKKHGNKETPIDYLGFDIPDAWVVGYGLDYADKHRTLPYIAELKEEVYKPK